MVSSRASSNTISHPLSRIETTNATIDTIAEVGCHQGPAEVATIVVTRVTSRMTVRLVRGTLLRDY